MKTLSPKLRSLGLTTGVFLWMSSFSLADSFFSKGSVTPNTLTNWSLTMDGTGASPANFTTAADAFTIQAHTMDTSALWTLAGSLTVSSGGALRLNSNSATLGSLTINSGGTVSLNVGSVARTLTLNGNLVNNGTLNALNTGQNTTLKFSSNAAWTGSGNISVGRIQLVVDPSVALNISGLSNDVTFRSSGTLASTVSGTLVAGAKVLNGNGNATHTFTLASGATLVTAHTSGVNGNFNWAGTLSLNSGASFTFNGTAAQVTGSLMPATVNHLSAVNASGVSLSKATTVSGILTVGGSGAGDAGTLNLAGFNHSAGSLASSVGSGRVITNNAASGTSILTLGTGNGNGTYHGTIQNGATAATALRKTGSGTQTLNGTNSYTGSTNIEGGTLALGASGSLTATNSVSVTGGTLLLGASNVIHDAAGITLAGGILNSGGFSEFAGSGNGTAAGLGSLTLNENSTIDFGTGTSTLWFSSLDAFTSGKTLTIENWSGNAVIGGGTDQLRTTSDPSSMLSQISFTGFSSAGSVFFENGGNSYYEIVPVPEPSTVFRACILLGMVGHRERRHLIRPPPAYRGVLRGLWMDYGGGRRIDFSTDHAECAGGAAEISRWCSESASGNHRVTPATIQPSRRDDGTMGVQVIPPSLRDGFVVCGESGGSARGLAAPPRRRRGQAGAGMAGEQANFRCPSGDGDDRPVCTTFNHTRRSANRKSTTPRRSPCPNFPPARQPHEFS